MAKTVTLTVMVEHCVSISLDEEIYNKWESIANKRSDVYFGKASKEDLIEVNDFDDVLLNKIYAELSAKNDFDVEIRSAYDYYEGYEWYES